MRSLETTGESAGGATAATVTSVCSAEETPEALDQDVVEIEGSFDDQTASQLLERVRASAGGGRRLVIDLSRAAGVADSALNTLAEIMREASAAGLTIHGLGDHQYRILTYLGVDPAAVDSSAQSAPEPGEPVRCDV